MHRFQVTFGWLSMAGLAAIFLAGSGPAGVFLGVAMGILILLGAVVMTADFLLRAAVGLARGIVGGRAAGRGAEGLGRSAPIVALGGVDPVERWCRQAGWLLVHREGDDYRIRSDDHRSNVYIDFSYSARFANVLFHARFPVRFPLEAAYSGVIARASMRNRRLSWSAWQTEIAGRCEAWLYLVSSLPFSSMNGKLFARVCEEMAGEIRDFHHELHDRFAYTLGVGEPSRQIDAPGRVVVRYLSPDAGGCYLEDGR